MSEDKYICVGNLIDFFTFQMTSLKEKIERDNAMRIIEKKYIRNTDMDLVVKFWFVNTSLFATNLGLCGFEPRVAYDILKLERVGNSTILVSYISRGKNYSIRFPRDMLMLFRTKILIKLIQG